MNEFLRTSGVSAPPASACSLILTNTPGGHRHRDRRAAGRHPRPSARSAPSAIVGGVGLTVAMVLPAAGRCGCCRCSGRSSGAMVVPALGVYGPELFPTSLRGKANGVITISGWSAACSGCWWPAALLDRWSGLGPALAVLAIGPLLMARAGAAWPTRRRPIGSSRSINPEDQLSGGRPAVGGPGPTGRLTAVPAPPTDRDVGPSSCSSPLVALAGRLRRGAAPTSADAREPAPTTTVAAETTTTAPRSTRRRWSPRRRRPRSTVFDDASAPTPTRPDRRRGDHDRGVTSAAGIPIVFLVTDRRADGRLEVYLPVRPNGSTGWVEHRRRRPSPTSPTASRSALAEHRIRVFKDDEVMVDEPVGVGTADTPDPRRRLLPQGAPAAAEPGRRLRPVRLRPVGVLRRAHELQRRRRACIGIHGTNEPDADRHRRVATAASA